MQLKTVPENLLEWIALRMNRVPIPLLHGQIFPVVSKAVLVAADMGIFEVLRQGKNTADEIANACQLRREPVNQLLQVLVSAEYLTFRDDSYQLSSMARRWMARSSPSDLTDLLIYNHRVVWKWMNHLETYLVTGKGVDYHPTFSIEEWELYQKAMRAVAHMEVGEFARKCPVPAHATNLLDIGGAPGVHVKALIERYPALKGHILDLPAAIGTLGDEKLANVTYLKGDVLETELPAKSFDLILLSSLAHHFNPEQNQAIAYKIASALRPGGIYIVNEFVNSEGKDLKNGLVGTSSNLFFGLTSTSGTWTIKQIQNWQLEAGLKPHRVIGYLGIPGRYQIIARKV